MSRLEKENQKLSQKLKAETEKSNASADYDLQAKCSKDAKAWFNENFSRDKDTMFLDFTNHYNKSLNKCFILVEYHFSFGPSGSWTNDISLWDIYENSKYGDFAENHLITTAPKFETQSKVYQCAVAGQQCKTMEEFNNLTSSYRSN